MRLRTLGTALVAVAAASYAASWLPIPDYYFYAGYTVLQFAVLAIAWNILGGYGGYVNFGAAGFFGVGVYSAVALNKLVAAPLPLLVLCGAGIAGALGSVMGLITLRLKGIYFAMATLALSVLLETAVTNWSYVGGARGAYAFPPATATGFPNYVKFLFVFMLLLTLVSIAIAAIIERSAFGRRLVALRDSEEAAEACGVGTLHAKVIAAAVSSALMGAAGAVLPFYLTFVDPHAAFGMTYSISAVAMAMIGGTQSWLGPLLGALVLGTLHQVITVTVSSAIGVLVLGLSLMAFVALAPRGLLGLIKRSRASRPPP
jgi:branched-chain amino acid transport system permease protein